MSKYGNWSVILRLEGIQRRMRKQGYSYWERLEKLRLATLLERRMKGDLIENFKIINGISNYG